MRRNAALEAVRLGFTLRVGGSGPSRSDMFTGAARRLHSRIDGRAALVNNVPSASQPEPPTRTLKPKPSSFNGAVAGEKRESTPSRSCVPTVFLQKRGARVLENVPSRSNFQAYAPKPAKHGNSRFFRKSLANYGVSRALAHVAKLSENSNDRNVLASSACPLFL